MFPDGVTNKPLVASIELAGTLGADVFVGDCEAAERVVEVAGYRVEDVASRVLVAVVRLDDEVEQAPAVIIEVTSSATANPRHLGATPLIGPSRSQAGRPRASRRQ